MSIEENLQEALDQLDISEGNKACAARVLGIPVSTFKDRVRMAQSLGMKSNARAFECAPTIIDEIQAEQNLQLHTQKQKDQDTIKDLRKRLRDQARQDYTAEGWRKFLWAFSDRKHEPPEWVGTPYANPGSPGDPTLILSDFHWGEVVNPEQVGGINKYDIEIAERRLRTTITNTIDLCFHHMVNPKYNGLVLALGGDMFSGDIHPELSQTNEKHVMQLLFGLFDHMIEAIDRLVNAFGHVYIVTAYGNHARNTMKPMFKDAAFTNFDWVLYNMIEHHYKTAKDDRVKINVANSFDTLYTLQGTRFLLTHGDRIGAGGGGGTIGMLAPIMRGILKLKAQYDTLGHDVDYVLMGHWHQLSWLKSGIVNGSLKGYDEFAMGLRFDPEVPQQALFFTHPTRGITFRVPVYCEGSPKVESKGEWVSVWKSMV